MEGQARFSPVGHFIAFVSTSSGNAEIYERTFPDATGQWMVSKGGGVEPRWRWQRYPQPTLDALARWQALPRPDGAERRFGGTDYSGAQLAGGVEEVGRGGAGCCILSEHTELEGPCGPEK